jgi:lipopolysaccharide transport system ATP-binding protein
LTTCVKIPIFRKGIGEARFAELRFTSHNALAAGQPYSDGPLEFELAIDAKASTQVQSIAIGLRDQIGRQLVNADISSFVRTIDLLEGRTIVRLRIEQLHLKPGIYDLVLWLARYVGERVSGSDIIDHVDKALEVEVIDLAPAEARISIGRTGVVTCDFKLLDISHPQALRDLPQLAGS